MASTAVAATAPRKNMMRSPVTWVIILGVTLAAGAYLLYRRSQSQAAATTTTTDTGSSTDFSGEISTLQTEIADLQSSEAQEGGTAGQGGGNGGTGSPGQGGGPGGGVVPPGGTGQPPHPVSQGPPVPALVRVTGTTATTVSLSWSPSPGATSYRVRLTYQGRLARQQSASKTAVTVTGLDPDHTYTCHVAAVGPSGTSRETNGPAAKTKRSAAAPKTAAHSVRRVA